MSATVIRGRWPDQSPPPDDDDYFGPPLRDDCGPRNDASSELPRDRADGPHHNNGFQSTVQTPEAPTPIAQRLGVTRLCELPDVHIRPEDRLWWDAVLGGHVTLL